MSEATQFDKDATSNAGVWRECAERTKLVEEGEADSRTRGRAAIDFRWGNQWPDTMRNARNQDNRPALTINHTNTFCQRQENTLRQQRPRIKCHPVGDGADIDTAATVNGIIRHIESISAASIAYGMGVKSAIDNGWGYWRIISRYLYEAGDYTAGINDQELLIAPIRNPFSVAMDPSAIFPDGRDQKWCSIYGSMKRAEYKRAYPNEPNSDWLFSDGHSGIDLVWENKEEIRLAEYYRLHEVRDTLVQMNDGRVVFESELPRKQLGAAVGWVPAVDLKGAPVKRVTSRCQLQWFRLNGKRVIDSRDLPGLHVPVVRCDGNVKDVDGKVNRKGMVQDLVDPAQMVNYWRTSQTERYALTPKAPWVVAEGQTDGHPEWHNANQKSYSTLVYKPVVVSTASGDQILPPPQRTTPAQIEAGMAEAAQSAEHDLMSVAGMPQENPEIAARVVGGNKYLQRRQGMQDLTHYQYYENQLFAIAWTGELLLERIPHYYDTQRMQRILGEDDVPKVIKINEKTQQDGVQRVKNDMTVGRYSVVMDTGPGYSTKREEAAENMVEVLGTPLGEVMVKTGPDVILRNMDFHGADELADRAAATTPGGTEKLMEGLPKQAQNIIGALQQQLQQKDEIIQQQALEIKYSGGVKEMQVHGKLEETDRNNETRIMVQAMKDATGRDVAEIHGATQLLNTRAESESEERQADALIKAGTTDRRPNGATE